MSDLTEILQGMASGQTGSTERLLLLVYDELRRLAAARLRREIQPVTLQPTALVHEAFLRLVDDGSQMTWDSKRHFFGAASQAMRRILVDNARRRNAQKRGGELHRQDYDEQLLVMPEPSEDVLALNEALDQLAVQDPTKAKLVELRYFAGLTGAEAAAALGISTATAERYWAYARAWLHQAIHGEQEE